MKKSFVLIRYWSRNLNEIIADVFNVNAGIKEEKKLQEGSEGSVSQSTVTRTEAKEVSLFQIVL